MYNSLGDANFTGKYKGIPLKANSITESLIEIIIDNKKVSFKKGDKIAVTKKVQNIINKILNESESEQKKDNTRIKKFVDSLSSEFKSVKIMPTKKKVTKKAVKKKAVAPRKKVTVKKKAVAPRKKVTVKKAVAPRKKAVTKKVAPRKKTYDRNIEMDSNRRALPKGKRISKNGIVYYEYRENHADNKQTKKKGQMLGMAKITGMPTPNDIDAMREIELYAINDGKLYISQRLPILKNLYKKYTKGMYDINKASILYRKFIDSAMKSYNKKFGSSRDNWYDLLSVNDRQLLAKEFAIETLEDFKNGEFNWL